MANVGISDGITQLIKSLYKSITSAILLDNIKGDYFKTTVGVRQGCLLSLILFNIYLEQIMSDTLKDHYSSISIGGRTISNLRFADDIDLISKSNCELQKLTDSLALHAGNYSMEVNSEKSKTMVNSNKNNVHAKIIMNGEEMEEVNQFKYLGATLKKNGSSEGEIRIRIATATSAIVRLDKIWTSKMINFTLKYNLYKSLVLSIFIYGCESWTILESMKKKIIAFENKSYRRLLGITYRQKITNVTVKEKIVSLVGNYVPLLAIVKK